MRVITKPRVFLKIKEGQRRLAVGHSKWWELVRAGRIRIYGENPQSRVCLEEDIENIQNEIISLGNPEPSPAIKRALAMKHQASTRARPTRGCAETTTA
jgi:hypothetical protein